MLTPFEAYFSKTNKFPTFSADFMESESLFDVCKCFNLDTEDFTFSFMTGKNLLWSNQVILIHTLILLTYKNFTEVLCKVYIILLTIILQNIFFLSSSVVFSIFTE